MTVEEVQDRLEEILDEQMTVYIKDDTDEIVAVLIPYEDYEEMKNIVEEYNESSE